MKTYIKFLTIIFFKSLFFVFFTITSLVFILNLLSELEFFKDENVTIYFTLFLALLNSPALIFEMFPFIILITVQLFFIKIFENREIEIFKYSGLKNSKILIILSTLSIATGIIVITIFYNLSSNLKNIYLELKSNYTNDGKYLAVITKNGLWIKDKIENKIIITNSSSIEKEFLIKNFITEFDENFNVIRNIESEKIDISKGGQRRLYRDLQQKMFRKPENPSSSDPKYLIDNHLTDLGSCNQTEKSLYENYNRLTYKKFDIVKNDQ